MRREEALRVGELAVYRKYVIVCGRVATLCRLQSDQ